MENLKLYNHNKKTYDNVVRLWVSGTNRVGVVQATGTGKSYIISECCNLFENKNILILAPKLHILGGLMELIDDSKSNITYMTYTKLNLLEDSEMESLNPDLIVLDEFHRCGANAWGKSTGKLLDMYKNSKVLGTTATNIRYLDACRDMAIEIFDDNLACKTSLIDAINEGILPAPTYVTSLYSLDEELEKMYKRVSIDDKNYELVIDKLDKLKDWSASTGVPTILRKHLDGSVNKFIVFCKSEKHLEEVSGTVIRWFKEAEILNGVESYKVTYKSTRTNQEIIDEFRNGDSDKMHLLFTIDILNEGLHIDKTGVILLRETTSPIIFLQQIGRALSVSNENPIIFDFVNNFNSLKIGELRGMITESRERLGLTDRQSSEPVDFKLYDETKQIRELLDEIACFISDYWGRMYDELVLFYKKYGHTVVPSDVDEYLALYKWCNKQRYFYSNNALSDERIEKLNELDFPWDIRHARWMLYYNKLVAYYKKYGTTRVPDSYNKQLNTWCISQRAKKDKLTKLQIELLDSIGFMWNVLDEEFEDKIEELLKYKSIHGDLLVPRRYPENPKLANAVQLFRQNKDKGILSEDRIERLDEIGFVWNVEDYNWNLRFNELSDYYKEIGYKGGRVSSYPTSQLSSWVSRQRLAYRNGTLSDERMEKLNSINFTFEIK